MIRLFLSLLAVLALLAAPARAEEWVVFSEEDFPPYNFFEDKARVGLDHDIVNAVLAEIGVTPVHRTTPWARVVDSVDQNQTDLAYQFAPKPARFESYWMVGPHRTGETVLAVHADDQGAYETLEDFSGKMVGVLQGYSYTPEFDNAGFITKSPTTTNESNVRKLAARRVDAIIGDKSTILYVAGREGVRDQIRILPKALAEVPRYIAFPRPREEKAKRFEAGLNALIARGEIQAIIDRWAQ